jgi:hypothetical protein
MVKKTRCGTVAVLAYSILAALLEAEAERQDRGRDKPDG